MLEFLNLILNYIFWNKFIELKWMKYNEEEEIQNKNSLNIKQKFSKEKRAISNL